MHCLFALLLFSSSSSSSFNVLWLCILNINGRFLFHLFSLLFIYLFFLSFSFVLFVLLNHLFLSIRFVLYDNVAEWSKACDSKSLLLWRRRFKSCRCRFLVDVQQTYKHLAHSLFLFNIEFSIYSSGYLFIQLSKWYFLLFCFVLFSFFSFLYFLFLSCLFIYLFIPSFPSL